MQRHDRHDPLTRAAIRHGSDKYGGHLYTPIYHSLFGHLREQPVRLLEIGVGGYDSARAGGLGLKMWAEYFPYGQIVGLDIHRKSLDLPPRVTVVQGSQVDEAVLAETARAHGPFDIVIDDGSHVVSHMIQTFLFLYPWLAADGFYAIEDVQTSFMPELGGRPDGTQTIFDVAQKVALAMHIPEGYVDPAADPVIARLGEITQSVAVYRNIVAFRRGPNTYPSNGRLDFGNAEVRRVFDAMTAEAAGNPAPGSALSRIDMLIWAGRTQQAGDLAVAAAEQNPSDQAVLHELLRLMEWAKAEPARTTVAGFLARL